MFIFGDRDNNNSSPIGMIIGVVVIILAPIVAAMIQMAVSRQREYLADATSAMSTRNPDAMVSALEKLKNNAKPMRRQNTSTAHLFFTNPLKPGALNKLFSTHPPLEDRIARLKANASSF
jgi:heat shock protein HtpX